MKARSRLKRIPYNKGMKKVAGEYRPKTWRYQVLVLFFGITSLTGVVNMAFEDHRAQAKELKNPYVSSTFVETKTQVVETYKPSIDSMINFYALKYGVSADEMRCTIKNESGFRKQAKNGTSTASGLGQYVIGTWKAWRTRMGENPDGDLRFDAEESIKTMAWAFSQGYQPHWEAWKTYCR